MVSMDERIVDQTMLAHDVEISSPDGTNVLRMARADTTLSYIIDTIDHWCVGVSRDALLVLIDFAKVLGTIPRKEVKIYHIM